VSKPLLLCLEEDRGKLDDDLLKLLILKAAQERIKPIPQLRLSRIEATAEVARHALEWTGVVLRRAGWRSVGAPGSGGGRSRREVEEGVTGCDGGLIDVVCEVEVLVHVRKLRVGRSDGKTTVART